MLIKPDWEAAALASVRPVVLANTAYLTVLIALVGTSIAPWMQFYLQAAVVEKGVTVKDYAESRIEVIVGCIAMIVVAFFIIVANAAAIWQVKPREITSAAEAARALRPFGEYAYLLFSAGLLNASLFAASILPLSTAYAVCEALGWETGVDRRPREAPGFFVMYTLMIFLGAAPILLPRAPLVAIMFWSQTLNGLLLPVVLLVMLKLVNDPDIMGPHVNSIPFNLVAWGTAAIMIALSLLLLLTSIV